MRFIFRVKFMIKNNGKSKKSHRQKKVSRENTEDRPSNSKIIKKTMINRTMTQSNNLGISFDPRREVDFEEDESREIANQIRSRTVFLVRVASLAGRDTDGRPSVVDDTSSCVAVLEACCRSASKRWQMKRDSQYVIDVEGLTLNIWLADKKELTYDKVSRID